MKNRILSTILALSLVLSSFMLFSVSVAAEGEIVIPKVDNGITLDGNLTEADWTGACNIESAQFKMLWDENYLYVGYRAPYREDMWGGSTNYGGYVGGGEYCTFQVFDDGSATAYTNHITVTPNLGNVGSASEIVPGAPYLMSYHKQDASGVYYPENVKINLNVAAGDYTLEAKIPWTEVNLDRSDLTAAQGDSFYMQIVRSDANVINPKALVVLGEAAEMPEVTAIPQGTVTVDGTLNDTEWFGAFYDENTQFKMLWDENFLYAGYVGTYNPDTWGASHDHGGFVGGGEYCLFQIFDSLAATAYTNHITVTPNLGNKTNANSASVLNAPNLMSYHKQDGSGAYYPDNAKITLDEENAIYTLEVKIPWTEINLDRSKLTAAQGDTFFMAIGGSGKAVFANTTEVVLGEAPERPAPTADYTASLGTTYQEVTEGQDVTFTVTVDNAFASGEITLTFDPAVLSFKSTTAKASDLADGTLKLATYGADGQTTIEVVFTAVAVADSTTVTLTKAAFSTAEKAETEDLTAAEIGTAAASVAVIADTYVVTLGDNLATLDGKTGAITVANGTALSFKVADTYTALYTDIVVKAGDEVLTAVEGVYTIDHAATVTVTGTPKTFGVTVNGDDNTLVTVAPAAPVYGTDFVVTLPDNKQASLTEDGYTYSAKITIGGVDYAVVTEKVTTIAGDKVTGDVVITVTKTEVLKTGVSITVTGDVTVAGDYASTATKGEAYTLTITPAAGYAYTVTAQVNGVAVELTKAGNAYTVAAADVTGDITFEITATVVTEGLSINKYLALDGTNMWLVKMVGDLADGKVYKYGDTVMVWSDNYDAYVCLVISAETPDLALTIVDGDVATIAYTNDINGTEVVDANDAQFVYNMYMAMYNDFTTVSMEKFLLADVNADSVVDVADAAAIVAAILA